MASAAFLTEMARLQESHPKTKVEYISVLGVTTDISTYYKDGARFEQIKERAPDEIQAGNFDLVCYNHDNKFSEYVSTSLFYGVQYHGAKIKVSQGFVLPDGTEEYVVQAVGYIDELVTDPEESTVTFRCRDLMRRLLDERLHPRPYVMIPTPNAANTGNGSIQAVETKPYKTKNETWTITCTTPGGDGVGIFSVVGSVTGSKGNATSGTEFSTGTGTGGIKFTLVAGGTAWSIGDIFTFTTKQHPEWSGVNAGKIIWSVLTGYNWDTDTQEAWSGRVLNLDHTKSSANVDLDYDTFVTVIANLTSIGSFDLYGAVYFDTDCVSFLQELTMLFIGSLYTGQDGRLKISSYVPTFAPAAVATFSDANKVVTLGYNRTIDEVINHVVINYKGTNVWGFSDEIADRDGVYANSDAASIAKYGTLEETFEANWYAANGLHAQDFADKLLGKYSDPPLNMNFETGTDALLTAIGDPVSVTDTKYNLSVVLGEVSRINKKLDEDPIVIEMRVRRESDLNLTFGFLGSRVDEGDGISPQATTYGAANATDKLFCYMGALSNSTPDYRMF